MPVKITTQPVQRTPNQVRTVRPPNAIFKTPIIRVRPAPISTLYNSTSIDNCQTAENSPLANIKISQSLCYLQSRKQGKEMLQRAKLAEVESRLDHAMFFVEAIKRISYISQ